MRNLKQETVNLLLRNKGFKKIGESDDLITVTFKDKVTYYIGDLGWSAYMVHSGETHYGLNSQPARIYELAYPYWDE
ncbi:hypothetical protein [Ammoniphilus sp. YIM 78166]|uniref:hypothetical protein n=1 Tax=Ammoniphilus sp. YIM 78166 TaxID=1644106 RepID=UPI00106FBADF|nr:hypothetical protein [Ammoniphilus sp. YIM 78166]